MWADIDEFQKLQKLHWEGASQPWISKSESANQTINQHSDWFSIVNLQWASFAFQATVIIAVTIVGFPFTFCCYYRAWNDRKPSWAPRNHLRRSGVQEEAPRKSRTTAVRSPICFPPLQCSYSLVRFRLELWLGGFPCCWFPSLAQPCPHGNPCSSRGPSSWHPAAPLSRFSSRQLPASGVVLLWSARVSAIRISFLSGTSCHLLRQGQVHRDPGWATTVTATAAENSLAVLRCWFHSPFQEEGMIYIKAVKRAASFLHWVWRGVRDWASAAEAASLAATTSFRP